MPIWNISPNAIWGKTGTGPRPTDDLTPVTRDALFNWQSIGVPREDFGCLTADSFLQTKICETRHYANSVLRTCHSMDVINKDTGHPDTTKINKSMVSKIAIISVHKQRELINMLFFWEEEITRWRLLCQEESELSLQLEQAELDSDLKAELERQLQMLRAVKKIPPSKRREDGRMIEDELPTYDESCRAGS